MRGPSPYTITLLRELLRRPSTVRLVIAQAEAKAIQLRGEAQAAAMRAQADALARNPVLVEMKKAENWDGTLPQQLLSSIVPFMQFTPPTGK